VNGSICVSLFDISHARHVSPSFLPPTRLPRRPNVRSGSPPFRLQRYHQVTSPTVRPTRVKLWDRTTSSRARAALSGQSRLSALKPPLTTCPSCETDAMMDWSPCATTRNASSRAGASESRWGCETDRVGAQTEEPMEQLRLRHCEWDLGKM
jgi:hypothetical protein